MPATRRVLAAFAACLLAPCAPAIAQPEAAHYIDPAAFVPERLLPPPPAAGSAREKRELDEVRRIVAAASPARLDQARWDGAHEDASAYNAVVGRDLAALPQTAALLAIVTEETEGVVVVAKDHFARLRPYGADPALPHCGKKDATAAPRSYPSGHASIGYAMAWTLVRLMPDRAPAILARADDYAMSRAVCGVHYLSDLEAGHVVGTLIAERLLADPRLAARIAAARTELSAH